MEGVADPISCRDVTCQNGAVCQDNETTRFFSCQCAASYVGTYCELEIVTNTTSVSTTAIVTKDATTPTGLSDEALVPFLSVLLVPPIGGVAVCGIIMCRRRIGTEEYEEGSEGSSGWIEDDLSSPSQAS
ncbi:hypothetical protein LSAT2_016399 [Lamellibrachia satsuma]|nr:hypothetical protein LSAT2_016399 [Lamellibrachia satsuma]